MFSPRRHGSVNLLVHDIWVQIHGCLGAGGDNVIELPLDAFHFITAYHAVTIYSGPCWKHFLDVLALALMRMVDFKLLEVV